MFSVTYIEEIAQAIHLEAHPDEPLDNAERGLYLIYAVLALTIGQDVTREHVHDAWSAWRSMAEPDHESIQPFHQLSASVQKEDQPFVAAIRAVAGRLPLTK